jgi:hypothetical protein
MTGVLGGLIAAYPTPVTSSFESIASATGTGSSGTITFSSIPSTYTSLQIRAIGRSVSNGVYQIQFNGDTAANYVWHNLTGNGSTAAANSGTAVTSSRIALIPSGASSNVGANIIDIHDYAKTTNNKVARSFTGFDINGSGTIGLYSALWLNTAAITSITLLCSSNFYTDSTFALYGIKGA